MYVGDDWKYFFEIHAVSFNHAVEATKSFFTSVFAYLMTLKKESHLTYITLIPIVTGVIIASQTELSFHLFGLSCAFHYSNKTSMNLFMYMAPIVDVFLLPKTFIMEENMIDITLALAQDDIKICWYLLFNSTLAYFVNLTNFLVMKHANISLIFPLSILSSGLVTSYKVLNTMKELP
ncbi:putative sugar phosphate/phosphate translocator [Hibiscus syriacus]|uniref:Sugar phosphate/phosphate translocator n=1 Tax=Hibiscus syriacus TaxID=106335 RepID=A0A6A2X260_HIBSY|nr:putative sugar phosphate/phosphate translocator [Hibiscus syriacus]